ncbi:hypothetical protein SAMN05421771_2647 [Granulicella pectinivorans]|uniref:Uncharacterized protein n=1 Tax=Granulicella pectinivorans TaxID=474950 RepID=A0A1I6MHJ1_9BACT|nr:hypothetical protein SAMN05421771_2647 [Granulicella pectinivorans]
MGRDVETPWSVYVAISRLADRIAELYPIVENVMPCELSAFFPRKDSVLTLSARRSEPSAHLHGTDEVTGSVNAQLLPHQVDAGFYVFRHG